MPSVLESLTSLLGQGDTLSKLGSLFDGDADQAGTGLEAAGPALIAGIADRASGDGGADLITEQLDAADPAMLDDVDGFLDDADADAGTGILDSIFGEDRDGLLDGLAEQSGLAKGAFAKLLPMLAPMVMSTLAKLRSDDDLDADGVVGLLANEKESLESDGKLGDWFPKLAAGGALGALGAAAAGAAGKLGDAKDAAVDAVSDAKDTAAEAKDAASDAKDKATAGAGAAAASAKGKAADAKAAAGGAKDSAKAGAAAATTKLTDIKSGNGDDNGGRRGGLGWLWWALGAVLLVLLLAWLLNQCGDDSSTSADGDDATETTADDGATTEAEETTTTEAEEETTTEAEETTTTAEETTTTADGGDLQGLVDAALTDAGITGVTAEVDGDVVTLTGSVGSEDDKAAAQAAAEAVDGVGSVDNQLTVGDGSDDGDASADGEDDAAASDDGDGEDDGDGSGDDDSAAGAGTGGDTLNDELGLEPITFAYRSAAVAPAGQAVLDEVVAYLEENADVNVEIQGHTDSDGTEAENLDLSTRRAQSVNDYLEGAGIDAARMSAVGYGEASPKVPNDTADNKAANRRIDFIVVS